MMGRERLDRTAGAGLTIARRPCFDSNALSLAHGRADYVGFWSLETQLTSARRKCSDARRQVALTQSMAMVALF